MIETDSSWKNYLPHPAMLTVEFTARCCLLTGKDATGSHHGCVHLDSNRAPRWKGFLPVSAFEITAALADVGGR